jgi:ComF family protein
MRVSGRPLVTAMRAVLRVVLPCSCVLCGDGSEEVVCGACKGAYAGGRRVRCARCANPLFTSLPRHATSSPRRRGPNFDAPSIHEQQLGPRLRGDDVINSGDDAVNSGDDVIDSGDDVVNSGDDVANSDEVRICAQCLRTPRAFDATVAAVDYAPPLDQIVLQLKFSARLPLAPWCARTLRDAILGEPGLPLPDLLCPVPLGPARLRERGFNQALEIARPLAALLGIPLHAQLAARTLETLAQSGTSPEARARNVAGAFAVQDPDRVAGRHVGLVDDVMTSGHTLDELAAACKRAGAARITNFVFARTPPSY